MILIVENICEVLCGLMFIIVCALGTASGFGEGE